MGPTEQPFAHAYDLDSFVTAALHVLHRLGDASRAGSLARYRNRQSVYQFGPPRATKSPWPISCSPTWTPAPGDAG